MSSSSTSRSHHHRYYPYLSTLQPRRASFIRGENTFTSIRHFITPGLVIEIHWHYHFLSAITSFRDISRRGVIAFTGIFIFATLHCRRPTYSGVILFVFRDIPLRHYAIFATYCATLFLITIIIIIITLCSHHEIILPQNNQYQLLSSSSRLRYCRTRRHRRTCHHCVINIIIVIIARMPSSGRRVTISEVT